MKKGFIFILILSTSSLFGMDLSEFKKYEGKLTSAQIENSLKFYLIKDPILRKQIQLDKERFILKDKDLNEIFAMKLASKNNPSPVIENPLIGLKIAIDPGHIGGKYSELEQRHMNMKPIAELDYNKDIIVKEGDISVLISNELKKRLTQHGAEVVVTRTKSGETVFKKTFEKWLEKDFIELVDKLATNETDKKKLLNLPKATIFRRYYNREDLRARADLINKSQADLSIMIHLNQCGYYENGYAVPVKENFSLVFVAGSFMKNELNDLDEQYDFLRLLLTNDFKRSLKPAKELVETFKESLGIPTVDPKKHIAPYIKKSSLTISPGVYARNLALTRMVRTPLIFGETSCMDNIEDAPKLDFRKISLESPLILKMIEAYENAILRSFN